MSSIDSLSPLHVPDALCRDVIAMLPDYLLHHTTPDEARLIEAVLPFCPAARQALESHRQIADALMRAAPSAGAPPSVDRLFARLALDSPPDVHTRPISPSSVAPSLAVPAPHSPATPVMTALPTPATTARAPRWAWVGVTAAAGIAICIALVTAIASFQLQQGQAAILARLDAAPPPTIAFTSASQYRTLAANAPGMDNTNAVFVWNPTTFVGTLVVTGMPPLAAGQTYQLWLVGDSQTESLGTFASDASGTGVLLFRSAVALDRYRHIGVSIEPESGSPYPTTPHVILGDV